MLSLSHILGAQGFERWFSSTFTQLLFGPSLLFPPLIFMTITLGRLLFVHQGGAPLDELRRRCASWGGAEGEVAKVPAKKSAVNMPQQEACPASPSALLHPGSRSPPTPRRFLAVPLARLSPPSQEGTQRRQRGWARIT